MRAALVLAAVVLAGCAQPPEADGLVVGTTTTMQDSGLLDVLLPAFERANGIRARAVVGGSGEIIEKARRGDVDVLLTHSPDAERALVAEGAALARIPVMHGRFVVAGLAADPAGVANASDASDALRRVYDNSTTFASRADRSGTHEKELALWRAAGLDPSTFGTWYKRTGSGQAPTLLYADERRAYVLADEGTLLQLHEAGRARGVVALFGDDPALRNEYAVTLMSGGRPGAAPLAETFAAWLAGADGQATIAAYRIAGVQAFFPEARA